MADIKALTLNEFEEKRKEENLIPAQGENFFFPIGKGRINLRGFRSDPNNYRFDLQIQSGVVYTGYGDFSITGDHTDVNYPYNSLIVGAQAHLSVNNSLTVRNLTEVRVLGTLALLAGTVEYPTQLNLRDNAVLVMEPHSILTIKENVKLLVDSGAQLRIFGRVDIHISSIDDLLDAENIYIDSAAVMNVSGLSNGNRTFSLTDYDRELRTFFAQRHNQGSRDVGALGRLGFVWEDGNPMEPSHVLMMRMFIGRLPLGDFRLSFLGMPTRTTPQMRVLSNLEIFRDATLYLASEFEGSRYYMPELYLGVIIGNNRIPARCRVDGKLIADGKNNRTRIIIDRLATLTISESGEVHLRGKAIMRSTHNNGEPVLFINGKLYVDNIELLDEFEPSNIVFGPNGKIIVMNPNTTGEKRILFETPNGIKDSRLYELFYDDDPEKSRIRNIEFHIPKDCGIKIDHPSTSSLFFSHQMKEWYGGYRFERAVKDGLIIWHEGAYIELDNAYISWINETSSLLDIGSIFKSYGSFNRDRLQDAVNRLKYAGCDSIIFKLVNGNLSDEVTMDLNHCHMRSTFFRPRLRDPVPNTDDNDWSTKDHFVLMTDNDGELFIRNRISSSRLDQILNEDIEPIPLPTTRTEFTLP